MQFQKYDLGQLRGGETVEVTLQNSANVKLMDSGNFRSYQSGGRHQFYGGRVTRSPFRVAVPHSGQWHVAIDLGRNGGTIRSSVRVL